MRRHFPKPRLAVLTLAALVAALVAGYSVVVKPQRSDASALAARIERARTQLDAAGAVGSGAQSDARPIRVADIFQLSRAIPDKPDLPDVLLQLSEIATETGNDGGGAYWVARSAGSANAGMTSRANRRTWRPWSWSVSS